MHKAIKEFETAQLKAKVPEFRPGDTLRVSVRIIEGEKQRVQDFQGICIGRKGDGARETFTVRRVSYGVGMERVFPIHSPRIEKIAVVRHGRVRRAKLYFLRKLRGKKARIREMRRPAGKSAQMAAALNQASAPESAEPEAVELAQSE
jgi:large subunit ribosomal protein L19